jgi:hypothetical protein
MKHEKKQTTVLSAVEKFLSIFNYHEQNPVSQNETSLH